MGFQGQVGQTKVHFLNQGKNATLCAAFRLGIFLFENKHACVKKLKQRGPTQL